MTEQERAILLASQVSELTESVIYRKLAAMIPDAHNKEVLERIAKDEEDHAKFFEHFTQKQVSPHRLKIFFYVILARTLGLTFAVKLMESQEDRIQKFYGLIRGCIPEIDKIIQDEQAHEQRLLDLLDEERLKYVSSIVLGLNDALVELTGALAGLTLALQNARLIALVGLITGIAASMSMAASEYLSTKQEDTSKNPLKASIYTGIAYIATVLFLIIPYLLVNNVFISLFVVLVNALIVVLLFTYYISVAKNLSFKKRFLEMAGLSLSVATINFFIGWGIRQAFGINI